MIPISDMTAFLRDYDGAPLRIMEVCGTHTAAIAKSGISSVLSSKITLLSGPGCPVCVTPPGYIDSLSRAAVEDGVTVLSFGDMLRVPGLEGSLNDARAKGGDIRMVYSPFDGIRLALEESDKNFVFAAVGFETIAPVYALMVERAREMNIKNLRLMPALKTMPTVLELMCREDIHGFIAPGHVAAITGSDYFVPLSVKHKKPFCVSGFTGQDVISAIYDLVLQISQGKAQVHNLYSSVVSHKGNTDALRAVERVFTPCDTVWRGMGCVSGSGLKLREEFAEFEAPSSQYTDTAQNGCRCGDVICGRITPDACPMFGKACTPLSPKGPCMVSHEGACGVWYETRRY